MGARQRRSITGRRRALSALAALLLLGAATPPAPTRPAATGRKRAVVLDVRPAGEIEASTISSLTAHLAAEVARQSHLSVTTSGDVRSMLELSKQQQLLGAADPLRGDKLGDSLGADYVVSSELSRLGDRWLLSISLAEPARGGALHRVGLGAASVGALLESTGGAVQELLSPLPEGLRRAAAPASAQGAGAEEREPAGGGHAGSGAGSGAVAGSGAMAGAFAGSLSGAGARSGSDAGSSARTETAPAAGAGALPAAGPSPSEGGSGSGPVVVRPLAAGPEAAASSLGRTVAWGALVAGAAAIAGGGYFYGDAWSRAEEPMTRPQADRLESDGRLGFGLLLGGAAAAGLAAWALGVGPASGADVMPPAEGGLP